ncbi:uroporphyrinogen-III synthase [Paenisporosarcina quisquiliarum]|uniref:uroporphyrinogen-III synthase n=1 Tax=Paenisporosarcina quisquiliarum TaxID=365346 RepID=UPI00373619F0
MCNKNDLQGRTIVFTSQPKSDEPFKLVERLGGDVACFPLIQVIEFHSQDEVFIGRLSLYEWLIFTSQNAVEMFRKKLNRLGMSVSELSFKVAAVGTKTASALEAIGLQVSFIPTIYSADTFIKEFSSHLKDTDRCLFLKGSLAKDTIRNGLEHVDEWTVYETTPNVKNAVELAKYLKSNPRVCITFASPSAVHNFSNHVYSQVLLTTVRFAAIGHITAKSLIDHGLPVHIQAKSYTYLALIDEIAKWKDVESK